jgi:TonB dependent receptor.
MNWLHRDSVIMMMWRNMVNEIRFRNNITWISGVERKKIHLMLRCLTGITGKKINILTARVSDWICRILPGLLHGWVWIWERIWIMEMVQRRVIIWPHPDIIMFLIVRCWMAMEATILTRLRTGTVSHNRKLFLLTDCIVWILPLWTNWEETCRRVRILVIVLLRDLILNSQTGWDTLLRSNMK